MKSDNSYNTQRKMKKQKQKKRTEIKGETYL